MNRATTFGWLHDALAAMAATTLAAFALVFSEWLFFTTSPSFLLTAGTAEHARILAVLPWLIALPVFTVATFAALPLTLFSKPFTQRILAFGAAALLAVLAILLLDNFTYTLFQWRLFDLGSFGRVIAMSMWLVLLVWLDGYVARRLVSQRWRRALLAAAGVLLVAAGVVAVTTSRSALSATNDSPDQGAPGQLPNIVIFSADGLSAKRLSAYGFHKPTTPFLEQILERGLVYENFFTNSANTTGSIAALLTGRLPTTTRMNFRPDLFTGDAAWRHLPGVLRTLGYYNAEVTVRHYADGADLNMQEAFHWANGRELETAQSSWLPTHLSRAWNLEAYFLRQVTERVMPRLGFLVLGTPFVDPYREVTQKDMGNRDADRLDQLRELLESAPEPFFINTHFMVTHGPKFPVYSRQFSAGREQNRPWMKPFYDDALLDVDTYLNFLFDYLHELGKLERTLVIFTTDHGERGKSNGGEHRLPLVFFFPGDTPAGQRSVNAQRIDIAPTILDWLGVDVPGWMEGRSLLANDIPRERPIFGAGTPPGAQVGKFFEIPSVQPPLYTLDKVYLFQCQRYWRLNLGNGLWRSRDVPDHTAPCAQEDLLTDTQAKALLLKHLVDRDYPETAFEAVAAKEPVVSWPP